MARVHWNRFYGWLGFVLFAGFTFLGTGCVAGDSNLDDGDLWAAEDEGIEASSLTINCPQGCPEGEPIAISMYRPAGDLKVVAGQEIRIGIQLKYSSRLRSVRAEVLCEGTSRPRSFGIPPFPGPEECDSRTIRARTFQIPRNAKPGTRYAIKAVAIDCHRTRFETGSVTATVCDASDTTCFPAPDAGADSGAPDSGVSPDGGTDGGPLECRLPDSRVNCAGLECGPGQLCCWYSGFPISSGYIPLCLNSCDEEPNTWGAFECDGPEDCEGNACRSSSGFPTISGCSCDGNTSKNLVICHTDSDCPASTRCCPANSGYPGMNHPYLPYCWDSTKPCGFDPPPTPIP